MTKLRDIAWAAGFLEGEGCFYSRHHLRITANQVNLEPLGRLVELFGGSVVYRHRATVPGNGEIYVWELAGVAAAGVMYTIYPFMSERRKAQIRQAIIPWKEREAPNRYKRFCKRGHDLAIHGQAMRYPTANGKIKVGRYCQPCGIERAAIYRAGIYARMEAIGLREVA